MKICTVRKEKVVGRGMGVHYKVRTKCRLGSDCGIGGRMKACTACAWKGPVVNEGVRGTELGKGKGLGCTNYLHNQRMHCE